LCVSVGRSFHRFGGPMHGIVSILMEFHMLDRRLRGGWSRYDLQRFGNLGHGWFLATRGPGATWLAGRLLG
jgi:hypothetical protein